MKPRVFVWWVLSACTRVPAPSSDATAEASADVLVDALGECVDGCQVCTPGELTCAPAGQAVLRCEGDGQTLVEAQRCDTARGQRCAEGRCVVPCAWAAEGARSEGCSFVAVSTLNASLGRQEEGQSPEQFPFAVTLANPWPVAAEVLFEGGGLPSPRRETVPPFAAHTVILPWVQTLSEGGDPTAPASAHVQRGAYLFQSSVPVAAYQFNPLGFTSLEGCDQLRCRSFTNDASLLLPGAVLGRRYTVVSRPTVRVLQRGQTRWQRAAGFVTIVAVEDGTEVAVRLRASTLAGGGVRAGAPGDTLTRTLDRGDVLQVVSGGATLCSRPEPDTVRGDTFCQPVATEDLTGSVVTASAPVAVWAGHDCALVPYNRFACDHLEEQLWADESLGRRYIAPRTPHMADEPGVLRVVATRPNTTVTVEPARVRAPVTLAAAGDFVEFEHRESVAVTATEPVVVAQFLVGAGYDASTLLNVRGDPAMALLPPVEQTRTRYRFVAAPGFPDSVAVAFAPVGERLRLDDRLVTVAPVDTVAGFAVYHLRVTPGSHTLESAQRGIRFGLVVSGLAPSTSYAYPGGLDLVSIAPPQ
jgi:hypothetical protein